MQENKFWNYSITIGNMIVTLAFGLGVGLVVLLFTLIVRSMPSTIHVRNNNYHKDYEIIQVRQNWGDLYPEEEEE